MFLMASNRTTDKPRTTDAETSTEAKPFSFSRLFNRNGHEKKDAAAGQAAGAAEECLARVF